MVFRVTKVKDAAALTTLFNKFVGREIPVIETQRTVQRNGRPHIIHMRPQLEDPDHASLQEMRKAAKDCGLKFSVWLPGAARPMENHDPARVNAHVEKGADGKYRLSGKFMVG